MADASAEKNEIIQNGIIQEEAIEEIKIKMSVNLEIGTLFGVRAIFCFKKDIDATKNAYRQADELIRKALSCFGKEEKLKCLSNLLPGKDSYYPMEMAGNGKDTHEWLVPSDSSEPVKVIFHGDSPFHLIKAKAVIDEPLPSDLYNTEMLFLIKNCLSEMDEDCSFSYRLENVPVIENYKERSEATAYMEGGGISRSHEAETGNFSE